MNVALLTAAGRSRRMQMETPKQFIYVKDCPVIVHTMRAFEKHPEIDAIIVVTQKKWEGTISAYAEEFGIKKLRWFAEGGETNQESIHNGLIELEKHCDKKDIVMVHDGNRPMISQEIITDSLATCREHGGAVAAIPCIEAIFRSTDGVRSKDSIPREELFRTQTPHTYSLGNLLEAHKLAEERHITNTTATCMLMRELGHEIYFSKGSDKNIKITVQDDLDIFEALLEKMRSMNG